MGLLMKLRRTGEFQQWFLNEPLKSQVQMEARLANLTLHDHFGDAKNLGGGLGELRWKNGRRVYFALLEGNLVLLLIGGHKNGQSKDIKKARLLIQRYAENEA